MADQTPQTPPSPQTPPQLSGFSFTGILQALQEIVRAAYKIQTTLSSSLVNLNTANTFSAVQTFAKNALFNAGSGTGTYSPQGDLNHQLSIAGVGNGADTTDDTLFSFSLPAASFDANGRGVVVETWGKFASNGNNKTVKVFFGSSVVFSTGVVTNNNTGWFMRLVVRRSGPNTQLASAFGFAGTTVIAPPIPVAGSETDTGAITIKVTGASPTIGAANDVLANAFSVSFIE